jgi:hypothetical protein
MPNPIADWSVFVYIAAHNDLDEMGIRSRDQILNAAGDARVRVAVLYDSWLGATRYLTATPGQPAVSENLGTIDTGDPAMLLEHARWAFAAQPAKRYALVLWSHGNGFWDERELRQIFEQTGQDINGFDAAQSGLASRSVAFFRSTLRKMLSEPDPAERAILLDNGTGHAVDTLELAAVCAQIHEAIGQPLDFLGMDACLMATAEVAYELRDHARAIAASAELVPGKSWPYDAILARLRQHPEQDGLSLAKHVVESYRAFYTAHPPTLNFGDVTKIALDSSRIEAVATALLALSDALRQNMRASWQALGTAQFETFQRETRHRLRLTPKTKFGYHLWDIGSLADALARSTAPEAVRTAARTLRETLQAGDGAAIAAEAHAGDWFDATCGLTLYMAPPNKPLSKTYPELALAKLSRWHEMLTEFQRARGTV